MFETDNEGNIKWFSKEPIIQHREIIAHENEDTTSLWHTLYGNKRRPRTTRKKKP